MTSFIPYFTVFITLLFVIAFRLAISDSYSAKDKLGK
jgi:hypothetical protein